MKKYLFLILSVCLFIGCTGSDDMDYNLIPVEINGRYGYVNPKGEYVINPQFDDATFFQEGIARVRKGGLYGYILKDGSYLCLPTYKEATVFNEGIAWGVKEKEMPVAIGTDGKELFTAKGVRGVSLYSEGLAKFSVRTDDKDILWGYLDKKGNVVIPPTYSRAKLFSNGLAAVGEKFEYDGYINKKGKKVIDLPCCIAGSFGDNGQAIVKQDCQNEQGYGVIDRNGHYVITPQFAEMKEDGDNYLIRLSVYDDYGFCDSKGKIIINPQFEKAYGFYDSDLCLVSLNEELGYIDRKGRFAINPQFKGASPFLRDCAIATSGEKIGLINKKGDFVTNPQFDGVSDDVMLRGKDFLENSNLAYIESQYLDIERVIENIKRLLDKGKLDGMSFPPSVKDIQEKYKIEGKEVPVYSAWEPKSWYWGEHLLAYLTLDGYFYNEVSDGWWGVKSVLNKNAKADNVSIRLNLFYIASGRASELEAGLQKAFKGEWGNYKLGIKSIDKDNVVVTVYK